jgi:ferric-dicitrate binding protein FerR (iron transport regulator)
MQYTDYAVEDFLLDASFRNYCLGTSEKDIQFWESWMTANPHRFDDIMQAKDMFFLLNGDIRPEQLRQDRRLFKESFEKHIEGIVDEPATQNSKPKTRFRSLFIYAGLAAAVVAGFFILPKTVVKPSPAPAPLQYDYIQASRAGERKSFQLPDGSKVMLNAGSTLTMAQDFNTNSREVTLEGEAFFDVSHNPGKPFIIHTTTMNVKVLGTIFNVKAYPADKTAETSLLKGSVEVTLKNDAKKKIILRPNEKIVLPNPLAEKPTETKAPNPKPKVQSDYTIARLTYIDSAVKEVSWTENRLAFTENSFEEIAPVLERWYNVSITFEDNAVKQFRYTATFDQKNIIQVLDALQMTRANETFDYTVEQNNRIIIRKR